MWSPKEDALMKRLVVVLALLLGTALAAQAAEDVAAKAKAEGSAAFYANITSVEQIGRAHV